MKPLIDDGHLRKLLTTAALCCVALSAGCAITVAGTARPARDSAGIIGIGRSIPQVLPTDAELHAALRSKVQDSGFPPSVGGFDILSGWKPAGNDNAECLGVTDPFVRAPYEGSAVRAVADRHWSGVKPRFWVNAGVVALASPRDAKALFTRFTGQWQRCRGRTVVVRHKSNDVGVPDYRNDITDVRVSDGMLTAVVTLSSSNNDSKPFPSERAIGIVYNCIIDVEVTDFYWRHGDLTTTKHAQTVVELMTAKAEGSS
jgi:hypothetical protein